MRKTEYIKFENTDSPLNIRVNLYVAENQKDLEEFGDCILVDCRYTFKEIIYKCMGYMKSCGYDIDAYTGDITNDGYIFIEKESSSLMYVTSRVYPTFTKVHFIDKGDKPIYVCTYKQFITYIDELNILKND